MSEIISKQQIDFKYVKDQELLTTQIIEGENLIAAKIKEKLEELRQDFLYQIDRMNPYEFSFLEAFKKAYPNFDFEITELKRVIEISNSKTLYWMLYLYNKGYLDKNIKNLQDELNQKINSFIDGSVFKSKRNLIEFACQKFLLEVFKVARKRIEEITATINLENSMPNFLNQFEFIED